MTTYFGNIFHCVCGVVGCDGGCCDCPDCKPGAWSPEVLVDWAAEAAADAQQEALADDRCYCDDVDMCPPCMRYLAAQQSTPQAPRGNFPRPFVTDTTPSVKLTPEQQALFDAECDDLPF